MWFFRDGHNRNWSALGILKVTSDAEGFGSLKQRGPKSWLSVMSENEVGEPACPQLFCNASHRKRIWTLKINLKGHVCTIRLQVQHKGGELIVRQGILEKAIIRVENRNFSI